MRIGLLAIILHVFAHAVLAHHPGIVAIAKIQKVT